jgi:hypothetical protein
MSVQALVDWSAAFFISCDKQKCQQFCSCLVQCSGEWTIAAEHLVNPHETKRRVAVLNGGNAYTGVTRISRCMVTRLEKASCCKSWWNLFYTFINTVYITDLHIWNSIILVQKFMRHLESTLDEEHFDLEPDVVRLKMSAKHANASVS